MIRSTIFALTFAAIGAAPLSASAGQSPSSPSEQTPPSTERRLPSPESSDDRASPAEQTAAYSDAELKSFAGAVVEVAEMAVVSAFGNVVARVVVDWPELKVMLVV